MSWSTVHIFWFGDVQIIGQNGKTKKASDLTKVDALIDYIWSKKPQSNTSQKQYHQIIIFNGMYCDWQAKVRGEEGYRIPFSDLDPSLLADLVAEIES